MTRTAQILVWHLVLGVSRRGRFGAFARERESLGEKHIRSLTIRR